MKTLSLALAAVAALAVPSVQAQEKPAGPPAPAAEKPAEKPAEKKSPAVTAGPEGFSLQNESRRLPRPDPRLRALRRPVLHR